MNLTTQVFIQTLGITKDLKEFLKDNPEILLGDPDFETEVLEQIALIVHQRFTPKEMEEIASFHESDEGQAWLQKNGEMADDIDKLFKAHVVAKLSQQLFSELRLLPVLGEDEEQIN